MGRVQKKNAKNYLLIIIATSLACILCIATVVGGIHMAFGQDHKKQYCFANARGKYPEKKGRHGTAAFPAGRTEKGVRTWERS